MTDSGSALADSGSALAAVARATLPPAVADAWIGLMRPAIRLRQIEPAEQPVAQLGGSPALPDGMAWPHSEAGSPLGFVAGIDLGLLPVSRLDIPLPGEGTLLLFYRDSGEDAVREGHRSDPMPSVPRLIYVPAGTTTTMRTAPPRAATYREVGLAGEMIATGPEIDHPAFAAALARLSDADRAFMADPDNADAFQQEAGDQVDFPRHRIGGHAYPVQGPVEVEVARQRLGGRVSYSDPALFHEASRWTPLVQIDSDDDAGMMWGDCGTLYWLARPADIAARHFDDLAFTFQCS